MDLDLHYSSFSGGLEGSFTSLQDGLPIIICGIRLCMISFDFSVATLALLRWWLCLSNWWRPHSWLSLLSGNSILSQTMRQIPHKEPSPDHNLSLLGGPAQWSWHV
jgi:hypothetical protein